MNQLGVCIVTRFSKDIIFDCLSSLIDQSFDLDLDIVVVDNASQDGTVEEIRLKFPNLKLILNKENLGFSRAVNQGLKMLDARYYVLLNPDSIILPRAMNSLFKFMEENSDVGIAGPKVLNRDGTLQKQCRRSEARPWDAFCYFSGLSSLFPHDKRFAGYLMTYLDEDLTHEAEAISGSCMMIRRQVIEQIGYLGEEYFAYQEDTDYCRRARLAGWKVFYNPQAQIIHYGGEGGSRVHLFRSVVEWHRSYFLYYRNHFAKDYPILFNALYYFGMLLKLGITLLANLFFKKKVVGTRKP